MDSDDSSCVSVSDDDGAVTLITHDRHGNYVHKKVYGEHKRLDSTKDETDEGMSLPKDLLVAVSNGMQRNEQQQQRGTADSSHGDLEYFRNIAKDSRKGPYDDDDDDDLLVENLLKKSPAFNTY